MNKQGKVIYERRVQSIVERASEARVVFPDWKSDGERWLFLAAHDDDIVTGAGLTLLAALEDGIETHAVITANGSLGYCNLESKHTIADIRKKEAEKSFEILGLPFENVHFLGFEDCNLYTAAGRRFADENTKTPVIEGATGLQNSYTYMLRKIRPTRIFMPTLTDLHPDHQLTSKEMLISVFHAQGNIWPELGEQLEEVPAIYEYSTYSDFSTFPTIRIRTCDELFEKKLEAIMAYESQEQIVLLVNGIKASGTQEYLREMPLDILPPHKYDKLFD